MLSISSTLLDTDGEGRHLDGKDWAFNWILAELVRFSVSTRTFPSEVPSISPTLFLE